ncbi:MAG: hypothetical protein ACM33T_09870 [Solirubrobacterales bacterium]
MRVRAAAAVALVLAALAGTARAAELVMFETPSCPWCLKWHRELGDVYPRTEEGRLLPLRVVSLLGNRPADLHGLGPVRVTPTFVVVECGRERGRVVGYNSDEQFWGELSIILDRMKREARPARRC